MANKSTVCVYVCALSIQLIFRVQAHILLFLVNQTNRHSSKRLTQTQGNVKKKNARLKNAKYGSLSN